MNEKKCFHLKKKKKMPLSPSQKALADWYIRIFPLFSRSCERVEREYKGKDIVITRESKRQEVEMEPS